MTTPDHLDACLALAWACGYVFHSVPDEGDVLILKLQALQVRLLGEPGPAELLVARSEIDWAIGFASASDDDLPLVQRLEEAKRLIVG